MFSRSDKEAIANQKFIIDSQTQLIKAQSEFIKKQAEEMSLIAKELANSHGTIRNLDDRIAKLEGYLEDLGINLKIVEGSGMWWSKAMKAISIKVDPNKLREDLSFAGDEDRAYATQLATAVLTKE